MLKNKKSLISIFLSFVLEMTKKFLDYYSIQFKSQVTLQVAW